MTSCICNTSVVDPHSASIDMQSHPGVQPKIVPAFECVSRVAFLSRPQSQQQLVTNFLSKGIQHIAIIRTYASLRTRTLTRVRLFTTSPLGPKVYNVFLIYYLNILIIVLV